MTPVRLKRAIESSVCSVLISPHTPLTPIAPSGSQREFSERLRDPSIPPRSKETVAKVEVGVSVSLQPWDRATS